jgi:CubicO group peptidase (beta-lactamase class C family)
MTAVTPVPRPRSASGEPGHAARGGDAEGPSAIVAGIGHRHPSVGLAVCVVRSGEPAVIATHGLADIEAGAPVAADTVFRIASVTKPFTATAVMQLVEAGAFDLDTPATDVLRAYRLVSRPPGMPPPTVRQLLTHTSGIPEVIHVTDLFHPSWGSFGARPAARSVPVGAAIPSLATAYGGQLPYLVPPGTAFAYANHGYATLGQIVEDVSGMPLDRYLRQRVFAPLGMDDTELERSPRLDGRRAAGYEIGARGPARVVDREWVTRGGGSIASTASDMGRFAAALLAGGAGDRGTILQPATLETMFAAHWQPDSRLAGVGLGFFRGEVAGHRFVQHDGRLPGFTAQVLVAPDDGIGIFAVTNGSASAAFWLPTELEALLRRLLGVPPAAVRTDVPHRPDVWDAIVGRYVLPPRISDLRGRLMLGGGLEVLIRGGRPIARLRVPVPGLLRGVPLHPDDPDDPFVFRVDLGGVGLGTPRIAFTTDAAHTDVGCLTLARRSRSPRRLLGAAVLGGVAAATAVVARRSRRSTW